MTETNTAAFRGISTKQLAERAGGLSADGIRVRLCKTGSYFGVRPKRLPNGRLLWPEDTLERLLAAADGTEDGA